MKTIRNRLRFGQLRLLAEMEDGDSIRSCAARLHMTQPAVSKSLKEVETILGARLYERTARGARPTAAGQAAARGAKLLLAELDMLANEIRQADSGEHVAVRIGITSYLGASLLPEVLTRVASKSPLGHVHLEEGWAAPLLDKLAEGSLDLLLIMCTPDMVPALDNPSLRYDRLCTEELAIVCAPHYPLASRRRVQLADLVGERWILGVQPSLTRRSLDDAFLHDGFKPPRPIIEATVLTTLLESAAAGLGLAALPLRGVQAAIAAGKLRRLNLRPAIALPPIVIVYRRLLSAHPRLASLADALRREFGASAPAARGTTATPR